MRVSRLRLRLAGSFALAILLGLLVVDVGLFLFLGKQEDERLRAEVRAAASGLRAAVLRESGERSLDSPRAAAAEALNEWPVGPEAVLIRSVTGETLAQRGDRDLLRVVASASLPPTEGTVIDLPYQAEMDARVSVVHESKTGMTILAARSTASLRDDKEALALWLLLSVPVVLLVSLPCGYLLAGRALSPFRSLAAEIESMRPGALDRRLPMNTPPDEIDSIAVEVNHLLDRLGQAQQQSQRFLAQAAHQLRTPLTLIRGESELANQRERTAADLGAALHRVSQAAGQMGRRVDDLFLLARAESGDRVIAREPVELDAVALDAVDLMRGRAKALNRQLALGTMEGVEVLGEEGLLREAALELLENACRHAAPGEIVISVWQDGRIGALEVRSAGPSIDRARTGEGLGLSIIEWIAISHGGELELTHDHGTNQYTLKIPLRSLT
jgi:signal transduction histidine kinase